MTATDNQPSPSPSPDPLDFERSMAELEAVVERMERGEQRLEEALRDFEHGIHLARHCQQALSTAEQKVEILLQNHEDADVGPFRPEDA